jgi:hypothetical protein
MSNVRYIFLFLVIFNACTCADNSSDNSLINTSHLEHLYQEIDINDDLRLGTVWIYSNAPDYFLLNDEDEGFTCVDDVSRALVFYCRQYKIYPVQENLDKIESLTRFIMYMKADNGYYHNFLFLDNGINTVHPNSRPTPNFWSWRAFWALTEVNLLDSPELNNLRVQTKPYLEHLLANLEQIFLSESDTIEIEGIRIPSVNAVYGPDQLAVIMIALTNYYQINDSPKIKVLTLKLGHYLLAAQFGDEYLSPYHAFLSWKNIWHAWGNMQAYALLYAGHIMQNNQFINAGLNEVKHFYPYCIEQNFISEFRLVRSTDSLRLRDLESFPQIAYGIRPMIFASLEAYLITGDVAYAILAGKLSMWFFGNNPAKQVMYDQLTGRTFDGINSAIKINFNSGAESTIEALLSIQAVESNPISKNIVMEHY